MASFRFRAQAALDLRRREHDEAQRSLAQAQAERQRTHEQLEEAQLAVARAKREADQATATLGHPADAQWYRFWIIRLEQQRDTAAGALAQADARLADAHAACLRARLKREALELFREKAFNNHLAAEAAVERKVIDELATRRFTARRDVNQGAEV